MRARVAPLVALQVRRVARSKLALITLVLAALLAWSTMDASALGMSEPAAQQALARQTVWGGVLLWLLPGLALTAAAAVARWREGEASWLFARPIPRAAVPVVHWLGLTLGGALLVGVTAWMAELAAGPDGAARPWRASLSLQGTRRLEPGQALRRELDAQTLRGVDSLRVRLLPTLGGGAPSTDAALLLERDGQSRSERRTVAGRCWLECPLPAGDGPLQVTIGNAGEGALALLEEPGLELWGPERSPRRAALPLFARATLLASALIALGLALARWMAAPLAAGLALLAWCLARLLPGANAWLPGADLPEALAQVGEGRLPAPFALASLAVLAGLLALAALSSRAAPKEGRS